MKMHGREIVGMGREGFLAIAPPFTGDILWEHLEILQKGNYDFQIYFKNFYFKKFCENYLFSNVMIFQKNNFLKPASI